MLGLARMAEDCQREAKQGIDNLLAKRSHLLESTGINDRVHLPLLCIDMITQSISVNMLAHQGQLATALGFVLPELVG